MLAEARAGQGRLFVRQTKRLERLLPHRQTAFKGFPLDDVGAFLQQSIGMAAVVGARQDGQIREVLRGHFDQHLGLIAVVDGHDNSLASAAPAARSRSSRVASP